METGLQGIASHASSDELSGNAKRNAKKESPAKAGLSHHSSRRETHQIFAISTSLVSGRKISAMKKLIAAIATGYQRPE
jgi:hypothetical protein